MSLPILEKTQSGPPSAPTSAPSGGQCPEAAPRPEPPRSPLLGAGESDEQSILAQCRDTTKLVSQLAAALKGLEADVVSLRRENKSLRKSMSGVQLPSTDHQRSDWDFMDAKPPRPCASQSMRDLHPRDENSGSPRPSWPTPRSSWPAPIVGRQRLSGSYDLDAPSTSPSSANLVECTTAGSASDTSTVQSRTQALFDFEVQEPFGLLGSSHVQSCEGNGSAAIREQFQSPDHSPWSLEQVVWLGQELDMRAIGTATVLDKDSTTSVSLAVEGLNRQLIECTDDLCIVYSQMNQGYYVLYRRGQLEKCAAVVRKTSLGRPSAEQVPSPLQTMVEMDSAGDAPLPGNSLALSSDSSLVGRKSSAFSETVPEQPTKTHTDGTPSQHSRISLLQLHDTPPEEGSGTIDFSFSDTGLRDVEELLRRGLTASAEDAVWQSLKMGRSAEASFDALMVAFEREGNLAKAQEWLWRMLEAGLDASEPSLSKIVAASCQQDSLRAEQFMTQMMHLRMRPSKSLFDVLIRVFAERRDVWKVEEWLLNAGQSGWTPEQFAFESVVLLFSERDVAKAEEWLSRSLQTDYRLPDVCYDAVVQALVLSRDSMRVADWLQRMVQDGRTPNDQTLQEAILLFVEVGEIEDAEMWLEQLSARRPVESLSNEFFHAAVQAGNLDAAERHLNAGQLNVERTEHVIAAHSRRGNAARAREAFDRFHQNGGSPTKEMGATTLATCVAVGDASGSEAVARAIAATTGLTKVQESLLRRVMGDVRASALLVELGVEAPSASDGEERDLKKPTPPTSLKVNSQIQRSSAHSNSTGDRKAVAAKAQRRSVGNGMRSRVPRPTPREN